MTTGHLNTGAEPTPEMAHFFYVFQDKYSTLYIVTAGTDFACIAFRTSPTVECPFGTAGIL
jgi:hypothetical protein